MAGSRIVVIGAGQAGGNVAVGLREEGFDGEIVLIGAEPDLPFGRPPLSKTYLRDEEDISGWLVKPGDWYTARDVTLCLSTTVERIDPVGARIVLGDDSEILCDAVCVATGSRPRQLPVPGKDLPGVHVLRTRADADAVKSAAGAKGAKGLVVGMGFIGAEVAASLRQIGVPVTAVFPGQAPLARVVGDRVGSVIAQMHREHGVELVTDETIASFRGNGLVEAVVTESGRSLDCTFAVLGVGVTPNVEFLEGSGIAIDNGVLVDATCRTNIDNVFAVGDVANHNHPLFGRMRVEHYNNAEKQGRHAARAMLGVSRPYDYVHTFWSDQYADKIEYVGYANEWDEFVVRGDMERRSFIGFYLKLGRMKAAIGINRGGDPELEPDSELAACARIIRDQTEVEPIVLTDEDRDLVGEVG